MKNKPYNDKNFYSVMEFLFTKNQREISFENCLILYNGDTQIKKITYMRYKCKLLKKLNITRKCKNCETELNEMSVIKRKLNNNTQYCDKCRRLISNKHNNNYYHKLPKEKRNKIYNKYRKKYYQKKKTKFEEDKKEIKDFQKFKQEVKLSIDINELYQKVKKKLD